MDRKHRREFLVTAGEDAVKHYGKARCICINKVTENSRALAIGN